MMIKSEKQLSNLAHRDRLTGLYNRHFMIDRMNALKDDKIKGIVAHILKGQIEYDYELMILRRSMTHMVITVVIMYYRKLLLL